MHLSLFSSFHLDASAAGQGVLLALPFLLADAAVLLPNYNAPASTASTRKHNSSSSSSSSGTSSIKSSSRRYSSENSSTDGGSSFLKQQQQEVMVVNDSPAEDGLTPGMTAGISGNTATLR